MVRVLFVDADNGARSQMAEAFLTKIGKRHCISFSAGIRKGYHNEYAVDVMKEAGLDISRYSTKEVMHLMKRGFSFQSVILVCNEKELDEAVLLPPAGVRLHWVFEDPSKFEGTDKEITDQFRKLRDIIHRVVKKFVREIESGHSAIDADLNFEPVAY